MDKFQKSCCIFVAYLRSLYTLHQNNHWTARGPSFYQDHLMYERIYLSAQKNADQAAEELVGLFGDACLPLSGQVECMTQILSKLKGEAAGVIGAVGLYNNSLQLEEEFLEYASKFYKVLKTEHTKEMSLGLDNLIMGICTDRETAAYLLRRSLLNSRDAK